MERQSCTAQATADASPYSIDSTRFYEETCIDRMCFVICCHRRMQWGRSSSNRSLTRPPGLTDTPKKPRMSDGTLFDVKSLSQDSMPAPTSVRPDRQLGPILKEPKKSHKFAGYSWPLEEQQQTIGSTCESQPSTSTSEDQFKQCHRPSEFSEQPTYPKSDDPESINPNADTFISSDLTTFQSVRQVVVNLWNHAKHLKFSVRRRIQPSSVTSPPEESPLVSPDSEVPSDIPKPDGLQSDKLILDSSGSSYAVLKKYGQTADEGDYLLPGEEGTGEQIPATSMSTPIKSFLTVDKLDVASKSTESMSTIQESISVEKIAGAGGYLPLLEERTDATISETSMSTPTKSFPSADELDVTPKSTESLPTTQESTSAEKIVGIDGYFPLLVESTGAQIIEISISPATPPQSFSSELDLDLTSKSTESLSTNPQSSGVEKTADEGGHLRLLAESTVAQESDIWMSTPTKSISSGVELDSISKSTESLSMTQRSISADKTADKGICLQFLKAGTSEQMSEFSISTSMKSFSSGDESDFSPKSTESLLTTEQSTGGEKIEVAALDEELEQTEAPHSQTETSNLEKNDFSSKSPQDEDEN